MARADTAIDAILETEYTRATETLTAQRDLVEQIRDRLAESRDEPGRRVPSLEEAAFAVRLGVVATFGDALLGSKLGQAPERGREAETRRFRAWLGDLLSEHLSRELREPLE